MFKAAGHGIAMGNACDELKEIAEYVTDSVNDDGIYHAFKHLSFDLIIRGVLQVFVTTLQFRRKAARNLKF